MSTCNSLLIGWICLMIVIKASYFLNSFKKYIIEASSVKL